MISVITVVVAADFIASRFHRPLLLHEDRRLLFPSIVAAGLWLYFSALGGLAIDVYRAGFSVVSPLVLALAAVLVAPRAPRTACLAIAVLVAFDLHLLRSRNLFDYVLDPLLFGVAIAWCVVSAWRLGHHGVSAEEHS